MCEEAVAQSAVRLIGLLQRIAQKFHERFRVIKRGHDLVANISLKKRFLAQRRDARKTLATKIFDSWMIRVNTAWSCLE